MRRCVLSKFPVVLVIITLLTCLSCIENTEEIIIAEDGTATITAKVSGPNQSSGKLIAFPSEPEWTITEKDTATRDGNMRIQGEMTVPYGQPLPATYAAVDDPRHDISLQFPSEIKMWTEGNRTYYQFNRTYLKREFRCRNITKTPLWDQNLENRILEKGIFEVSEGDREAYLNEFVAAYGYMQWRFLWETLGEMCKSGDISLAVKQKTETDAGNYMESEITPTRILGILGKEDEAMGQALDDLETRLHLALAGIFSENTGPDNSQKVHIFNELFQKTVLEYKTSEAIGGHQFTVSLQMPGTVIEANGLVDPENQGAVEWFMLGDDFYDADFSLHALSVVEH